MKENIAAIVDELRLKDLSEYTNASSLNEFCADIDEYTQFVRRNAMRYQEQNISHTHLLININNFDIVAYITLVADSVTLLQCEKDNDVLGVPFATIPAVKIAKLAVSEKYKAKYFGIGSYMVDVSRAIAIEVNKIGVACRYLTVDADIMRNPTVVEFYKKNRFVANEKYNGKGRNAVSMRSDLFYE